MNDFAKVFLSIVVLLVLLVASALRMDSVSCAARWEDSGRKHDWSIYGGCRVSDKDGRMVPEKIIRDIQ